MTRDELLAAINELDAACNPEGRNWKGFWTKGYRIDRLEVVLTVTDEYGECHELERLDFTA